MRSFTFEKAISFSILRIIFTKPQHLPIFALSGPTTPLPEEKQRDKNKKSPPEAGLESCQSTRWCCVVIYKQSFSSQKKKKKT